MRPNLYYRTPAEIPQDFAPKPAQADILTHWMPPDAKGGYSMFSVSMIASRNKLPRGRVQRQIRQLLKMGLIACHYRHH